MKIVKLLVAAIALLPLGCATFERGPMQRVHIESDPPGATVELTRCGVAEAERTAPVTLLIPRRVQRCSVLLLADGYEPARIFLERRRAEAVEVPISLFDELCGSCDSLTDLLVAATLGGVLYGVGKGVDAVAGSNWQLEPSEVQVALVPAEERARESSVP